jgi:hypothetical protein
LAGTVGTCSPVETVEVSPGPRARGADEKSGILELGHLSVGPEVGTPSRWASSKRHPSSWMPNARRDQAVITRFERDDGASAGAALRHRLQVSTLLQ